jgi:hypothetical protein
MKKNILKITIILSISIFAVACSSPKSNTVVVVYPNNIIFAQGEPEIKYSSRGAHLDYFVPGAIIILRTDYNIVKHPGKAGMAYQITRDTTLSEIGKIDTTFNDTVLVNNFLIKKIGEYSE